MLSKFLFALFSLALLCSAEPGFMVPLYKGPYDPSARSVPMASAARTKNIIANFREHMKLQFAKRAVTLECGLFDVFFPNPEPSDDYKEATCFALREILSSKLDPNAYAGRILVTATFEVLTGNVLGAAGPTAVCQRDGAGYYLPAALLQLEGSNSSCFSVNLPSITMKFNTNVNWYFGLDGDVPTSMYDFVTVASHELTHGLGFLSLVKFPSSTTAEYDLPELYFIDSTFSPPIDRSSNPALYNWAVTAKDFTYTDFQGTPNSYPDQKSYAPNPAEAGSSLSHFNTDIHSFAPPTCKALGFDRCNSLMRPALPNGLSIHRMGGNVMNALDNMGYVFFDCRTLSNETACLGSDTVNNDARCDWCKSDSFCTDITLVDHIWVATCQGHDYEFHDKGNVEEDAASMLSSLF